MGVRRPALPDLVGYLLGVGALLALPSVPHGPLLLALGLGIAVLVAVRWSKQRWSMIAGVLLLALGFVVGNYQVGRLAAEPLRPLIGHSVDGLPVLVTEAWHGSGYGRIATGEVLSATGGPVLLRINASRGPDRGSILRVGGTVSAPRGSQNGFDEQAWLAHQGIHAVLRVGTQRVVGRRGGLWGIADRARAYAVAALAPAGVGDPGQIVVGLAFGGSAGMSPQAVVAFRASGLAHLLAVSGGNVALLVALVVLATWSVGGNRRQALVCSLLVIILYVGIVGPSPSVLRAGVAGIAGCLTWLVGRPRDAWRALALGFGCLLAWNPCSIYDPGLQLSFVAVAGILLVVPYARRISEATAIPYVVATALLVTGAATLATAPISWWHFGRAAIFASLPSNLLAAPAVPLALWSALVATIVTPVAPSAGAGIAWCSQWPALWILWCARLGEWLALVVPDTVVLVACAVLALIVALRRPRAVSAVGWRGVRNATRTGLPAEWHGPRQDSARTRAAPRSLRQRGGGGP
ncbi:MAG: ComEC family competence protein [Thermoleophilia bacterium]|nr:ComEC family competence protein [Thermoleophilia bacterium]